MVNPQEFTSPAQKRISLIKPKASRTLLHIRLAFSRSLKAVVPKHVASSCFGTVRFKLCNKTKQCRRIKPFRVSLSRVISQTNFTEIQRVTVSRTRARTQGCCECPATPARGLTHTREDPGQTSIGAQSSFSTSSELSGKTLGQLSYTTCFSL